uniref:Glutathione S-transferase n=1 Tax=Oncorhynchus mykiss TaxID=8022 RepID=A0A8K9UX20_ONCMY
MYLNRISMVCALTGRAEVIRVMLKDQGAEFDEKVITMEMWKESTLKASCLFGQLPIFEDGDLTLYQTNAIRRHLARKLGLYGKDQREAALIDMMDEAIQDLLNKYVKLMFEKDDSGKEGYLKALPTDLKPFEKTLSGDKGSFLVGDKVHSLIFSNYHQRRQLAYTVHGGRGKGLGVVLDLDFSCTHALFLSLADLLSRLRPGDPADPPPSPQPPLPACLPLPPELPEEAVCPTQPACLLS